MSSATTHTLRLASDVPDVNALGAASLDDLFAEPPRVETAARAVRDGLRWRVPLPGTPDEHGVQRERPRGAGTGHLLVRRWSSGALERARVRLSAPRSTSPAAREWNLTCHLQAHGLAAPALVLLAERDGGRESLLIVRELEGFVPMAGWLDETDAKERELGLRALELALAALLRSGASLPRTTLDNVLAHAGGDDCAALQITNLASEQAVLRERGLSRGRLPALAFTELGGGRIGRPREVEAAALSELVRRMREERLDLRAALARVR